jgi:hypothetical protein
MCCTRAAAYLASRVRQRFYPSLKVRFPPAPNVAAHRRSLGRRADPFAPLVVTAEKAAEADSAGRELVQGVDDVHGGSV